MSHTKAGTDNVRARITLLWVTVAASIASAALLNYTIRQVAESAGLLYILLAASSTLIALILLGVFLWCYLQKSWRTYIGPEHVDQQSYSAPTDITSLRAEVDALKSVDSNRAIQFLYMVAYPSTIFDRISESAEPLTRSLSITTTITLTAVGRPGDTVVAPVLMRQRGSLTDGLRFYVGDDRVSSLSRRRVVVYSLAVVRSIIAGWGFKYWYAYCKFAEDRFARAFSSSLPTTSDAVDEMVSWIRSIAPKDKAESAQALGDFIHALQDEEPLCVPVQLKGPSLPNFEGPTLSGFRDVAPQARDLEHYREWLAVEGSTPAPEANHKPRLGESLRSASQDAERRWLLRLVVRRRSILQFHLQTLYKANSDGTVRESGPRWIDRVRLAFGIRATLIAVPLHNASRARSYHLSLAGLDGTYLVRQQLTGVKRAASEPGSEGASVPETPLSGNVVTRARNGQRHAHLYITGGKNTKPYVFSARFYERMPGSMAPAFASALSVTVLVAIAAFAYKGDGSHLFDNWEYAALVLAFPSVISLWLGFTPERRLSEGVLAARVSTISTVVLAVFAAASSIAQGHEDLGEWWIGLLLISIVNTAAPLMSWLMRAATQAHFIDAPPRDE
jgi:hypothetical protein